ncbi:TPA: superoxide dismutase [Legionella pneumophila subsp. pneumophila]|nr:superoxide dismutase [Legionella pneumophila subsp. pneumophila]RYW85921.1 superoxide dismutase [Legionella pneumophila]AOW55190.1 superoxide dismutase [Legionella pneumophila subsp. pneumophila]AOW59638.1 superoxide dismutase [Legionella pneumophila subsp. pneumophila]AOW60583.1 superoxide dismutase [Legionella pneumophila subsp. pneumophila]
MLENKIVPINIIPDLFMSFPGVFQSPLIFLVLSKKNIYSTGFKKNSIFLG